MTTTIPSADARDHHCPGRSPGAIARRLLAFVAIAGAVSFSTLGLSADRADAAASTKSSVIAGQADRALDALDRWTQTQNPMDYIRFVQMRDQTAATAEADVELVSGALQDAWASVSITNQEAVLYAVSQLGVPYSYLASEPGVGFDCSGLTIWAYGEAGVEIPRISGDQIRAAEAVDQDNAVAGDLVYYPGHISIYIGADAMVHSPYTGSHVEIVHLPTKSLQFGDATSSSEEADGSAP